MARRKTILATNEIYHVYNRGVEKRPIFLIKRDYTRFIETTNYYRFANCPMRFSYFKLIPLEEKDSVIKNLEKDSRKVTVSFYSRGGNLETIQTGVEETLTERGYKILSTKEIPEARDSQ